VELAIILLSCNQVHLTYDVISDIRSQSDADIYVIDNGGPYERQSNELIIKPSENLRWVKGNNLGLNIAFNLKPNYDAFILLNDDIRLSQNCIQGLEDAYTSIDNCGLVAPLYDDVFQHQKAGYQGNARDYQGVDLEVTVPFVDGTAFLVPSEVFCRIGYLDEINFGRYGWGADLDYNIRTRQAGYTNIVTHRSYINHFHQGSAKFVEDDWSGSAGQEMHKGMHAKYGDGWNDLVWDSTT
jgi:GT2 family glycosyltransferase